MKSNLDFKTENKSIMVNSNVTLPLLINSVIDLYYYIGHMIFPSVYILPLYLGEGERVRKKKDE